MNTSIQELQDKLSQAQKEVRNIQSQIFQATPAVDKTLTTLFLPVINRIC